MRNEWDGTDGEEWGCEQPKVGVWVFIGILALTALGMLWARGGEEPKVNTGTARALKIAETQIRFPPGKGYYLAVPLKVRDGDTVTQWALLVDCGKRARVPGIDAPELKTEEGKRSREQLAAMLESGKVYEVRIDGEDKYGWLVDWKNSQGYWVSKVMQDTGHARPWDGRGPKPYKREESD